MADAEIKILGELKSATGSGVLADAQQIKNGYIVVKTIAERDALKPAVLALGMPVYVSDEKRTYRKTDNSWERSSVETSIEALQSKVNGLKAVSVEYDNLTENLYIEGMVGTGLGGSVDLYLPFAISLTGTFKSRNISEMFDYTNKTFRVDWGDGTINTETTHTYATEAEYTIKVYGEFEALLYARDADSYKGNAASTLTAVEIGQGVKAFGGGFLFLGSFYGCNGLMSVKMHDGITSIPFSTFYGCDALENIVIPEKVTKIGVLAFGDSGLKSITIPKNVVEIEKNAFLGCTSLESVIFKSETPPTLGENVFKGTTVAGVTPNLSVVLTVPEGCVFKYKEAAGWNEYADLITENLFDSYLRDYRSTGMIRLAVQNPITNEILAYIMISDDGINFTGDVKQHTISEKPTKPHHVVRLTELHNCIVNYALSFEVLVNCEFDFANSEGTAVLSGYRLKLYPSITVSLASTVSEDNIHEAMLSFANSYAQGIKERGYYGFGVFEWGKEHQVVCNLSNCYKENGNEYIDVYRLGNPGTFVTKCKFNSIRVNENTKYYKL